MRIDALPLGSSRAARPTSNPLARPGVVPVRLDDASRVIDREPDACGILDDLRPALAAAEARIMDMVASGDALYVIAREYGATPGALARWLGEDQDRALAFSKARESAAHVYASAVVAVACDDARLEGDRRVRISALQWAAAKFAPRVYGERLDITTNDAPISDVADVEARLSKLLIQLGESRKALKPLK